MKCVLHSLAKAPAGVSLAWRKGVSRSVLILLAINQNYQSISAFCQREQNHGKCWHQTSAGAGFASQKHAKYQVHQEYPRISKNHLLPKRPIRPKRPKDSRLRGFTRLETSWNVVECCGIASNSLSSLGREDLGS